MTRKGARLPASADKEGDDHPRSRSYPHAGLLTDATQCTLPLELQRVVGYSPAGLYDQRERAATRPSSRPDAGSAHAEPLAPAPL